MGRLGTGHVDGGCLNGRVAGTTRHWREYPGMRPIDGRRTDDLIGRMKDFYLTRSFRGLALNS